MDRAKGIDFSMPVTEAGLSAAKSGIFLPGYRFEAGQELSGYAVALSDHADRGSGPDRVAKAPLKRTTQADTR
jgi:hypothetical protein